MKFNRRYIIGIGIIFIVLLGIQSFNVPYIGGWEVNTSPSEAYEHNLGVDKSLSTEYWSDWTHGVDFDASATGAPDLKLLLSRWVHTDGRMSRNPSSGFMEAAETPWSLPYKSFVIPDIPIRVKNEAGEDLFNENMEPVYTTTEVAYDLHLFYQQVIIATSADVEWRGDTHWTGDYQFYHETSFSHDQGSKQGDLGKPMDVTVKLLVDITPFPIRTIEQAEGYDTPTRAGIMTIKVDDYNAGNYLNKALEKQGLKQDLDWAQWVEGTVAEGSPQSGILSMFWEDESSTYQPSHVTPDNPGLPRILPEKLIINLHAKMRAGYVLGWDRHFKDELRGLIPVDQWIEFGISMEVLTVRNFWIYSDPYGNYLKTPETWRTAEGKEEPSPAFWDFLKGFDLFGLGGLSAGLIGIGVLLLIVIIGRSLFKRAPQMQALRRIGGQFKK